MRILHFVQNDRKNRSDKCHSEGAGRPNESVKGSGRARILRFAQNDNTK